MNQRRVFLFSLVFLTACSSGSLVPATTPPSSTVETPTTAPPAPTTTIDLATICEEYVLDVVIPLVVGMAMGPVQLRFSYERYRETWDLYIIGAGQESIEGLSEISDDYRSDAREMRMLAEDAPGLAPTTLLGWADVADILADSTLMATRALEGADEDLLDDAERLLIDAELGADRLELECDPDDA